MVVSLFMSESNITLQAFNRTNLVLRMIALLIVGALFLSPTSHTRAQQSSTASPLPAPAAQAVSQIPATKNTNASQMGSNTTQVRGAETAPQVVAVVHRLSGWKLRAWLTQPDTPSFAEPFDEGFVRMNVVAGYLLPDGRFVVARLPQADAEMLNLTVELPSKMPPAPNDSFDLMLVRSDGAQFKANFVGLDGSTGLSLLESAQPLHPATSEKSETSPLIGQNVRVIAPVRAASQEGAPVGAQGVVYMNMDQALARLSDVKRSPSGKLAEFTLKVDRASPELAGGVALSDTGVLVGIVDESNTDETRLISAEMVRGAAARILARRASVPQPWLGARGDAIAANQLKLLLASGWPRDEAQMLISKQQGVVLTDVAPGTPAALAGLRPGDVVARISEHEIHSVEDVSLMLRELGGNATTHFTILRAQSLPLELQVQLSESLNPARATGEAEARAAEEVARQFESEVREAQEAERKVNEEFRQLETEFQRLHDAGTTSPRIEEVQSRLKRMQSQLNEMKLHEAEAQRRFAQASERAQSARHRLVEIEKQLASTHETRFGWPISPLLPFGLEAITVPPAITAHFGAESGLLVVAVHAGSPASNQVRVGDVISTVNGQAVVRADGAIIFTTRHPDQLLLGIIRDGKKIELKLSRPVSTQKPLHE